MSFSRKLLASLAGAAVALAGVTVLASPPATANPAATDLVINEVYGAGGNSSAVYNADFVELLNPTAAPIDLLGKYVTYRSAAGAIGGSMSLRGTLPAGATYLVRMSSTGATGAALPTPDRVASPSISMAASGGQVILQNGAAPVTQTGNLAGAPRVVDMVGLDATAGGSNSYEFSAGPAATAAQSANRTAGTDTDDNSDDFTLAAPSPAGCGCVPAGGTFTGSIAEIQGTNTDTSPHLDDVATTTGVVTAKYPVGGFNGFFLQTGGTGGAVDTTPGAADGIFVFTPTFDDATLNLGDGVSVVGEVTEFSGLTEITADTVTAQAGVPAVTAWSATYPTTAAAREAHEGELMFPTNQFTVTNTFDTNRFAEIGLATGTTPLIQPTDVALAGSPAAAAVVADNAARGVTLDDGASLDFTGSASGTPLPWLGAPGAYNPVRVGAKMTLATTTPALSVPFPGVILDFRNNLWKFQPRLQVTNTGPTVASFVNTRTNAPRSVGGDLKLATFNVLNYFNTTGEDYNTAHPGACTFFNDRQGNPITVNTCTPTGPRGAANAANLARQQTKIVKAINAMDADIVSLEEIENSAALGEADRDDAVSTLVAALNADAGSTRWMFAPRSS